MKKYLNFKLLFVIARSHATKQSLVKLYMIENRHYYVYINTNKTHNVFYTGVTNNILNRNYQHKNKENQVSFTAKYKTDKLVWYETFNNINNAIAREKQIKAGSRKKKIDLINKLNPTWKDLVLECLT